MQPFIPYGKQIVSQEDIDAVADVLKSDFLTQGPVVPLFEAAIAKQCQAKHAVATNSATSALHIACLALGLGKGDIAWTSPNTFVASANCALYCGADIDFVDINPADGNMCIHALKRKLEQAKLTDCLPKVVIPVHFAGQSCEMDAIARLSKQYGFKILEDASHGIGGQYKSKPIGCCEFSDITVFSFHPVKIITSGEGGMAVTNDLALSDKMRRLSSHGVTRDAALMDCESDGGWFYQQIELGYNYRMTDIHAALGLSQMTKLKTFVNIRMQLAERYDTLFAAATNVVPLTQRHFPDSAWHLYVVRLTSLSLPEKAELFKKLREKNIGVNLHYIPVHLQPWYKNRGFKPGDFPDSERYYQHAISLPLHPGMTKEQQNYIANTLLSLVE